MKKNILLLRDIINFIKYGYIAPKYAELIWVNPNQIIHNINSHSKFRTSICSGDIIDISKYFTFERFCDTYQYRSCLSHWIDHMPWNSTPDYIMMLDGIKSGRLWVGCKTEQELLKRYQKLDNIFLQVKNAGRLKTRKELDPQAFREEGGIIVCIGEKGEPLLFDGYHRLSIAVIQNLSIIPAQLGAVDTRAVNCLKKYRVSSSFQHSG